MKRSLGFGLIGSTVAFGLAGFFLRRWQLKDAFEEATGLLAPGRPSTAALVAVMALAAVVIAALSVVVFRGKVRGGYLANLAAPNLAVGIFTLAAGALLFAGGVLGIRDYALHMNERVVRLVLSICLVPTGVAVGLIGLLGQQRKEAKGRFSAVLTVPGYCACVWLIASYQGHTANPNIMEYAFLLLGIMCVTFACYAAASFSFEKPRPVMCGVFSALGTVLLTTSAADLGWGMELLVVLGFALHLLVQLFCLTWCRVAPPQLEEWTPPAPTEKTTQDEQEQPRGEEDE